MNQLLGWGFALVIIGGILGLLHFAEILIGDTLSWVAGAIFAVGAVMVITGAGTARTRQTRA